MTDRYLKIYLRDHLAMARAEIEVCRRIAQKNSGNVVGRTIEELADELDEEARAVDRAMELLHIEPSQLKLAGAWLAEKAGRLKLNGEWTRYSPLSRLLEIEALTAAVEARRALWMTLSDAVHVYPVLKELPIARFLRRGDESLRKLRQLHQKAARTMLKAGRDRDERIGPPGQ